MIVTVSISKTLDETWAMPEQFAGLSDSEIVELVKEDLFEFMDGSCVTITRTTEVSA
jgi:hypothetical protein